VAATPEVATAMQNDDDGQEIDEALKMGSAGTGPDHPCAEADEAPSNPTTANTAVTTATLADRLT
jgi:hypothetical protein